MTTIHEVLTSKGQETYTISAGTSIEAALRLMAEKGIGALVVMDGGSIVGMFSERDFTRKTLSIEGFSLHLPVEGVMTTPVYVIKPDQTLEEGMTMMTELRIRHLPVMDNGNLVGLVSIRDVVKWLIEEKSYKIHELERFVYSPPQEDLE